MMVAQRLQIANIFVKGSICVCGMRERERERGVHVKNMYIHDNVIASTYSSLLKLANSCGLSPPAILL